MTGDRVQIVRGADLLPSAWANGQGRTRQIHRTSHWRLSLATIEAAGPFSVLPGVHRYLLLASDTRLDLSIDGTKTRLRFAQAVEFDGEDAVQVVGISGTTTALNLMTYRGFRGRLTVHHTERTSAVSNREAVAVTVLAGRVLVEDLVLSPHDTLLPGPDALELMAEQAVLAYANSWPTTSR